MRLETKTVSILLCAALALSACSKKTITPAVDPQPAEVGFTAASQATLVKSDTKDTTPLSNIHPDFGVWGIARQGDLIYNLWGNEALMDVNKNVATGYYEPEEAAYWLKGYTYNFLAVAPYADAGLTLTRVTTKEDQTGVTSPSDYMTFTYDMSGKYAGIPANGSTPAVAPDYDFDLLGAAAQSGPVAGGRTENQSLMFWHLFSKICIKVNFVGATGTVDQIRLSNVVTKGTYVISQDEVNDFDKPLSVTCTPSTDGDDMISPSSPLILNSSNKDQGATTSQWTLHVIPQVVSGFDMYIDFTIGESSVENFKVNLSAVGTAPYTYNGSYNWTLNITPNDITFDVAIVPWGDDDAGDNDFDFE